MQIMKRKYYLRGIGVGILFATIVLFTAYSISGGKELSDEEIMKRAEELGMVKSESVLDHLTKPAEQDTDTASEQDSANSSEASETVGTTGDEDTDVSETENSDTEASTSNEQSDTEASTAESSESGDTVTITVENGMSALDVGNILQQEGVIEDSMDFAKYMMKNGYSYKVLIGEYQIAKDADYETIAKILMGK